MIELGPLLPTNAWYDDSTYTRQSSTTSLSPPGTQPPVHPIDDLTPNELAIRGLGQLNGCPPSPHPSLDSTPGPKVHVVQKPEAEAKPKPKAKTRPVRRVASAADKAKAKAQADARLRHNQCLARAWQECLNTNPYFILEGVTKDGERGLCRQNLTRIGKRVEDPCEIAEDQLIDLQTICHRQFREMLMHQIDRHLLFGRYLEALELDEQLKRVGTYL